jgi:hypothetical protein
MRKLVLSGLVATAALVAPRVSYAAEARTANATIAVSSSAAASALGLTLVEGVLRYRDKVYLLTLRGARPTAGSTGTVYGLEEVHHVEGSYTWVDNELRNQRGVTIVFDPPLDLPGGQLQAASCTSMSTNRMNRRAAG